MDRQYRFKHAWWVLGEGPVCKPKDEWEVVDIVNSIRDKPDWVNQFKDETILSRWKDEIKHGLNLTSTLSDAIIDLIVAELNWTISKQNQILPFKISLDDKIIHRDCLVGPQLKQEFESEINRFKSTQVYGKQLVVRNLIDYSLYPFEYGVTLIINNKGVTTLSYEFANVKQGNDVSTCYRYQRLPSLFTYNQTQNKFEIKSYINNLHPIKFKSLYTCLESIFNTLIPGLNYVLSRHASKEHVRIHWSNNKHFSDDYDQALNIIEEIEDDDEYMIASQEFDKVRFQYLLPPEINIHGPIDDTPIDLTQFTNIKVFTRMVEIELNEDNPVFDGELYTIEGLLNEDIVATAIYFTDENVTPCSYQFTTAFDDPPNRDDLRLCQVVYGVNDSQLMNRSIGSIDSNNDRILIFANIYEQKLGKFKLNDYSKIGYKRMLIFHIVDPTNDSVISTDQVPPQQQEWWEEEEQEENGEEGETIITKTMKQEIKWMNPNLPKKHEINIRATKGSNLELNQPWEEFELDDLDQHPFQRKFNFLINV